MRTETTTEGEPRTEGRRRNMPMGLPNKSPGPVDNHVGNRVRMRRLSLGMSQEKLGQALGVSFQQIQKYEKGVNRIGASRLHQIAATLGVPIDFFYEGAPGDQMAPSLFGATPRATALQEITCALATTDGLRLMKAFAGIGSSRSRALLVDLATTLAEAEAREREDGAAAPN